MAAELDVRWAALAERDAGDVARKNLLSWRVAELQTLVDRLLMDRRWRSRRGNGTSSSCRTCRPRRRGGVSPRTIARALPQVVAAASNCAKLPKPAITVLRDLQSERTRMVGGRQRRVIAVIAMAVMLSACGATVRCTSSSPPSPTSTASAGSVEAVADGHRVEPGRTATKARPRTQAWQRLGCDHQRPAVTGGAPRPSVRLRAQRHARDPRR